MLCPLASGFLTEVPTTYWPGSQHCERELMNNNMNKQISSKLPVKTLRGETVTERSLSICVRPQRTGFGKVRISEANSQYLVFSIQLTNQFCLC